MVVTVMTMMMKDEDKDEGNSKMEKNRQVEKKK